MHYHFVFAVKYRRALLSPDVVAELMRVTAEIEARYEIEVECLGADRNHIHLLCSAHPKIAPGDIVRIYKSITARELFRAFPGLRKELWGGAFWSEGYFVATASNRGDWKTLVRYIKQQGLNPEDEAVRVLLPEQMESGKEPSVGQANRTASSLDAEETDEEAGLDSEEQ